MAFMILLTMDANSEKNDCVVRALAVVCGLSYEDAHERLRVAGRHNRKKTPPSVTFRAYTDSGLTLRQNTSPMFPRGTTVHTFLQLHPNFTGALRVNGHMFGVVYGFILNDWINEDSRKLVKDYWV
jgi:hypothetical protein